jgi:DDE superfamily endonuclease
MIVMSAMNAGVSLAVISDPLSDALCYLAAWDAGRAKLFDRCAPKDGIVPFDALVEQFMTVEPYCKAQRVFLIVDNGSAHRGQRSIDRLQSAWPNLILVQTPVHASWLNQAEIYLSIVQRKVLTPNDFAGLDTLERQLLAFGRRYEQIATPFEWIGYPLPSTWGRRVAACRRACRARARTTHGPSWSS